MPPEIKVANTSQAVCFRVIVTYLCPKEVLAGGLVIKSVSAQSASGVVLCIKR